MQGTFPNIDRNVWPIYGLTFGLLPSPLHFPFLYPFLFSPFPFPPSSPFGVPSP